MDQAQGAIDAARAAGAEQYAATEYTAATQALKQANDAVTERDYRLALNYALESREQAQNAARTAADTRAKLRGDVERSIAEAKALIAQAHARMDGRHASARSRAAAPQRATAAEAAGRRPCKKRTRRFRPRGLHGGGPPVDGGVKQQIQSIITTLSRGSSSQSPRRQT